MIKDVVINFLYCGEKNYDKIQSVLRVVTSNISFSNDFSKSDLRISIATKVYNIADNTFNYESDLISADDFVVNVIFVDDKFVHHDKNMNYRKNSCMKNQGVVWVALNDSANGYLDGVQYISFNTRRELNPDCFERLIAGDVIYYIARELAVFDAKSCSNEFVTKIFVSHSKRDGYKYINTVKEYFNDIKSLGRPQLFIDFLSMDLGTSGVNLMKSGINESVGAIVILSNNYSDRDWCIAELLMFKEKNIPVVILDAINSSGNLYNYFGNVPVISYSFEHAMETLEMRLYIELIQKYTNKIRGEYLLSSTEGSNLYLIPQKLEAYDLVKNTTKRVLYSDPAIKQIEAEFLKIDITKALSYYQLLDEKSPRRSDKRVMISAGFKNRRKELQYQSGAEYCVKNLAYTLLIRGHKINYGGNFGENDIADILANITKRFIKNLNNVFAELTNKEKLFSHFVSLSASQEENYTVTRAENFNYVNYVETDRGVDHSFRQQIIDHSDVIIACGGYVDKNMASVSGVIGEIIQGIVCQKDVFLLGGFGGAVKEFVKAVLFGDKNGAITIKKWEENIAFYCDQNNLPIVTVNQLKQYFYDKYNYETLLVMRECSSFIRITETLYKIIL